MIILSENPKLPEECANFLKRIAAYNGEEEGFEDMVNETKHILRSLMQSDISDTEVLERASLNGIINDLDVFKEMVSEHADLTKLKTVYLDELNALYFTINDIFRQF